MKSPEHIHELATAILNLMDHKPCPRCGGKLYAERIVHPQAVRIACHAGHSWELYKEDLEDVKRSMCSLQKGIQGPTTEGSGDCFVFRV